VTKATPEMRRAMAEAEVGDDIREGDPTAQRLEAKAAEITGHEAAVFCSSGTMGNLLSFMCHLRPGEEVIAERDSHFLRYESGGVTAIAGGIPRTIAGVAGRMDLGQVETELEAGTSHKPRTALIVAENTHNMAGGTCLEPAYMQQLWDIARAHDIPVHLDGARVWNAAVALGVPVSALTSGCQSVMVDLSKGLCAPYGSLLCGETDFIVRARSMRQRVGGGVRQIGHMAAAGLVALETMVERLAEDHANARRLAEGIHRARPELVDLALVQTNIVIVETAPLRASGPELAAALADRGVLCHATGPRRIRLVTHRDVGEAEVEQALEVILAAVRSVPAS
jgi:threonine aldolase